MKQDQYDNSNGRLNASSLRKLEKEFMCWFKEEHTDHSYEIWKRK